MTMCLTRLVIHPSCQHLSVLPGLCFCLTSLPCRADIIYQQFEIPTVNGWPVIGLPSNPYLLDIDNDGVTDFIFRSGSDGFAIFPQVGSAVLAVESSPSDLNTFALPLMAGQEISSLTPVAVFWDTDGVNGSVLTSARDAGAIGLFTGQIAYLGVQFTHAEQTHYGWLHLDVSYVGLNAGNLLALGWEDRPGFGIAAGAVPEPSTWALMIVGVLCFVLFRRKKARANHALQRTAAPPGS
jgi:hypothetical protein